LAGAAYNPAASEGNRDICFGDELLESAIAYAEGAMVKKALTATC